MIVLDATTKSLEVVLAGAVTTNQLPIVASYVDVTTTAYTPKANDTATNNTTAVTPVAAPAASTQRQVKLLTVYNADTVAAAVTVRLNSNSTMRVLCKVTLAVGSTLVYTDGEGWRVLDASGNVLTSSGAAAAVSAAATEQTTTATGTQNDFDLTASNVTLRCTGASPVVFTGFKVAGAAPTAGARVTVINAGATTFTARVAHEDSGSTAAYRIIGESARGQIVGLTGAITLVYDDTTDRWRITAYNTGNPIPITFAAGNFTGGGSSTWTVDAGDVSYEAYQQRGVILTIWLSVASSTTGGTPAANKDFALPNGFTVSRTQLGPAGVCFEATNGWRSTIFQTVASSPTVVTLVPVNFVAIASVTNGFDTYATTLIGID